MITLDVFKCGKRISIYDKYKHKMYLNEKVLNEIKKLRLVSKNIRYL